MASSDSPLGHLGDQIVTPIIPQSWIVQSKAVDMTNVESSEDLATALSSDHIEADSLLLVGEEINRHTKNCWIRSCNNDFQARARTPHGDGCGFLATFSAWPAPHETCEGAEKRGSTEFDDYIGTAQQKEAFRARWAKKQYDEDAPIATWSAS